MFGFKSSAEAGKKEAPAPKIPKNPLAGCILLTATDCDTNTVVSSQAIKKSDLEKAAEQGTGLAVAGGDGQRDRIRAGRGVDVHWVLIGTGLAVAEILLPAGDGGGGRGLALGHIAVVGERHRQRVVAEKLEVAVHAPDGRAVHGNVQVGSVPVHQHAQQTDNFISHG